MAVLSTIVCNRCGKSAEVNHPSNSGPPKICSACFKEEVASERERHFAELDALSVEERLRRVEAWIYNYRPDWGT